MVGFKGGGRNARGNRTGLGTNFRSLITYLTVAHLDTLRPDRVAWLAFRNLPGVDQPAHAAREMRAQAGRHPRLKRPVYHFGLSLRAGEHLSPERWHEAADRVLRRLGLADHQALVVAHRDTAHEHVHIVVNRAGPASRSWLMNYDLIRTNAAIREIEIDFGLTRDGRYDRSVPAISSSAYREALQTGRQPLADRARLQVPVFAAATGWRDLEERLAAHGLRLEPARETGLVVTDGRRFASLSHVDESLSGPKLARRFGASFRDHRQEHPEPPTVRAPDGVGAPASLPGASLDERAAALLAGLTAANATFTSVDLHRAAFYQQDSVALVRAALRSGDIVQLGSSARFVIHYTTREYLSAEARLLAAAAALASRDAPRLEAEAVARGLDRTVPGLPVEQRAAVAQATAGPDLALIAGSEADARAATARAIAAAYREQGWEVKGAALTDHGVALLGAATGIDTRTLAGHERAWDAGAEALHARSVLILDEAGAIDVRQLGRILDHAAERGARVVLLGDIHQLQAVGAGDAFRGLLDQHPSVALDAPRPAAGPGSRALREALARGGVAVTAPLERSARRGAGRSRRRPRPRPAAGPGRNAARARLPQ
jgi:hypothetical protein